MCAIVIADEHGGTLYLPQDMVIGNDNTLYAALKSVPCVDYQWPESDGPSRAEGGGAASTSGDGAAADGETPGVGLAGLDQCLVARAQASVAASMLRGVRGQVKSFVTTTAEVRSPCRFSGTPLPDRRHLIRSCDRRLLYS